MDTETLRSRQAPLKARYRTDPPSALVTLHAAGSLSEGLGCAVETPAGRIQAGLHPAAGGGGDQACSGDMLLQALVACAGVTLQAVATAMAIELRGGTITAEGDLDFRGTLGVDRDVPVGFTAIRMRYQLDSDEPAEKLETLLRLTERYCVVQQTLRGGVDISVMLDPRGEGSAP